MCQKTAKKKKAILRSLFLENQIHRFLINGELSRELIALTEDVVEPFSYRDHGVQTTCPEVGKVCEIDIAKRLSKFLNFGNPYAFKDVRVEFENKFKLSRSGKKFVFTYEELPPRAMNMRIPKGFIPSSLTHIWQSADARKRPEQERYRHL